MNCSNKLSKVSIDTFPSSSAILNPMNPALGLVSWFYESGFGFRKSGLNKRNGFWNRFQFWSNQTGPWLPGWSTQISRHRSSDWDNIGFSCRLHHLNKHSRWDEWQDKVSFCSLIRFNWRVPARVPLFSIGLKVPRSPCGHSGRLSEVVLTNYRRREVRNSIYRYQKNPYRLSIEIFISIYIVYIDNLRQHYA